MKMISQTVLEPFLVARAVQFTRVKVDKAYIYIYVCGIYIYVYVYIYTHIDTHAWDYRVDKKGLSAVTYVLCCWRRWHHNLSWKGPKPDTPAGPQFRIPQ